MPPILTTDATITCAHNGQVQLIPKQQEVTIKGAPILCAPDLVGAPIAGCAQPPSAGTKPCTVVASTFPGSTSLKVVVAGRPAYVATLSGLTDGVPPAPIIVVSPGQASVQG
jgi:hypothetical protein